MKSSSDQIAEVRSEQRAFDCGALQQSPIPLSAQEHVLSLLPPRLDGETDLAYYDRLPTKFEKALFDWWNAEVGDARKHKEICKV